MDQQFRPWRKSSKSDGGSNCVEVSEAVDATVVRVRDSKDKSGPALSFTGDEWRAFIAGARDGEFDLA